MTEVLPRWTKERFSVGADPQILEKLTQDLQSGLAAIDPGPWTRLPDKMIQGSMTEMLDGWCGVVGKIPLSAPDAIATTSGSTNLLAAYDEFLRKIDHQHLLDGVTFDELAASGWRLLDLGSLLDFLLISAFVDIVADTHILEIGGGFGRFAEFLPKITAQPIKYVNIDAAPVSLMYSYRYLQSAFPDKRVRLMERGEKFNDDFDFLIVPFWCSDQLPRHYFDIAINIESMQEMNQEVVDYYVQFLDDRVRDNGLIYLVNSREHIFKGRWSFPENWECLYRHRTIRSWTANHPTEVFRRTIGSQKAVNLLRQAAFSQELDFYCDSRELAELKHSIKYGKLNGNAFTEPA